jgi:hypothetical protein
MRVRWCIHKHTHSNTDTEHRHIGIHTHKCHYAVVWTVPMRILSVLHKNGQPRSGTHALDVHGRGGIQHQQEERCVLHAPILRHPSLHPKEQARRRCPSIPPQATRALLGPGWGRGSYSRDGHGRGRGQPRLQVLVPGAGAAGGERHRGWAHRPLPKQGLCEGGGQGLQHRAKEESNVKQRVVTGIPCPLFPKPPFPHVEDTADSTPHKPRWAASAHTCTGVCGAFGGSNNSDRSTQMITANG